MADRQIVYPTEVPFDTDVLNGQLNMYIGIAQLARSILGVSTLISGLPCVATSPASLAVDVGAGVIYKLAVVDATDYGSIPADNTNSIVKQGYIFETTELATPAPVTVGFSVNYLVQIAFSETDINPISRPYYNSASPTTPIYNSNPETRQDLCVVAVKAGTPATTGTQVTPSPDAGYVGAWVVTVAHGQTTVTSGDISLYPTAQFIEILGDKISQTTADARYARPSNIQSGQYIFGSTTGTDTYAAVLTPALTAYTNGQVINTYFNNPNATTTPTINYGPGVKSIVDSLGNAVDIGGLSGPMPLYYNSGLGAGKFQTLNAQSAGISIVQIQKTITGALATGTTQMTNDDNIPTNTQGDQYMSISITPKNVSNDLVIQGNWVGSTSAANGTFYLAVFQDSVANAIFSVATDTGLASAIITIPFLFSMPAGTTSSTTFKVRVGYDAAGTTSFNGRAGVRQKGGSLASSVFITEYGV